MQTKNRIIEFYGPQLGELAWHSVHVDSRIAAMSEEHAASIVRTVERCKLTAVGRPIRILEVGAYAHYGAHLAAARLGGASVVHDISPASLRVGLGGVHATGVVVDATLVAGDFHDLPFNAGYFDIVFCASSVHHTFRPWRVLEEMLRVIRPGGALQLENEPIGRALCFYGFRSNREPEFTPFEAELDRRGSLFTFSSPFPGSRPESLFGMTENDRIPLDMVLRTLTNYGEITLLQLVPRTGEFERRILALRRDYDLEATLAAFLMAEIEAVKPVLTQRDQLLGARLPQIDDVWRLSYQVAPKLRRLAELTGRDAEYEMARLFGAALQATVTKQGDAEPQAKLFRRQVSMQDGVFNDLPVLPGIRLHLGAQSIPAIERGELVALASIYGAEDWEPYREQNGLLSMLNLGSRCRITLPRLSSAAILLLRFFAVAVSRPYRVTLHCPKAADVTSVVVAQSESLLLRELMPKDCGEIYIETKTLEGEPISIPRHIRLTVGRLIPVEQS
jgi:SAM-dependent methyltransferase